MDGVRFDILGEGLADGAFVGLGRVGRTHHLTVFEDGVFAFEHLHHHRAGDHEFAKVVEEGALPVHAVEGFGLGAGELDALLGHNAEPRIFEHLVDGAGQVAAGGIGFDDRKGAFASHGFQFLKMRTFARVIEAY